MKKLLSAALFAICSCAATAVEPSPAVQDTGLHLIPWPAQIEQRAGVFTLKPQTTIAGDDAFAAEAAQLGKDLSLPADRSGAEIILKKTEGLAGEGYTLDVTPTGVTIAASTSAGAFYGCQTLRQLVAGKTIPCVRIQDAPRLAWRGFMLDVSRQFFDKTEVEAVLDQMAALKLNTFHWHLTDDDGWRIEIKKYPKLTTVGAWHSVTPRDKGSRYIVDGRYGGFYTQEEIREVVTYAAQRHIRVVPEIDMPGHMSAAAAAYPELSPANGWTPVVYREEKGSQGRCAALCVARPQTVQFCKDVLSEVIQLFPSKEIHVGGDEVFYDQWEPCPDMRAMKEKLGAKDWQEVQVAFGNDIAAFVAAQGRTAIFWNNIYRHTADKGAINQFWRNMNVARNFAEAGYEVVLSPYQYYFKQPFTLDAVYRYDPLAIVGAKPEARSRIRGIEGCAWTPHVSTFAKLQDFIYPRIIAIAETAWTPQESLDWGSFQKRLEHCVLPGRANKP